MVRRIKGDLIDTLDFPNKLQIAISDILILPVCFLKVKPKVNKKIRRNKARFHCLFAFRWIPNTKTWNTQFKIWNTQLSQKEVGKYPIASNPYLELCWVYTCQNATLLEITCRGSNISWTLILTCDDKYFPNFVRPSSCNPSSGNILKNLSTEATSLECTEASNLLLTIPFNLVSASCSSWNDVSSELPRKITVCLRISKQAARYITV